MPEISRTVPAERRCGEDLHEDSQERLVERRSKWQGERPSQCDHRVKEGAGAAAGTHDAGEPSLPTVVALPGSWLHMGGVPY